MHVKYGVYRIWYDRFIRAHTNTQMGYGNDAGNAFQLAQCNGNIRKLLCVSLWSPAATAARHWGIVKEDWAPFLLLGIEIYLIVVQSMGAEERK